ncbi:MAG TPA: outer membrane protein assembly factor BamA [Candidatus Limnocylindrales bacterium]|nr:outer membrane protein assembly factor BamA [Candidatus Limnocylindrales bacterium]
MSDRTAFAALLVAACVLAGAPAPSVAQRASTFGADSAAVLPGAAKSPAVQPAGPSVIRSVRASGFANVDSTVILRTFALKAGDAYDPVGVRAGVRRLFATGLFTDVDVQDTPTAGGVDLNVAVKERSRVQSVQFSGARKIEEKTLRTKITVATGQLVDAGALDLDARKIQDAYAEEGYSRARVQTITHSAGVGAVAVTFQIEEGPKLKVRGIEIHGAGDLSSEGLRKSMKSKTPAFLRSGTFKPSQIEEDETKVRLYMRSRGYRDADVDSIRTAETSDGKGVTLHVYVREGPRYRFGNLTWSGNTEVPLAALTLATTARPGTPYNESQIQKTLEQAYSLYQEQGYLFLSIDPKFADRDSIVDVQFQVQEGARSRVADLRIVGNTRTKENVIRREASIRPGDVFRRSALIRTQRDIFGLGYFQDVNVDYEPTGDSADIRLTLKVQEKQTGTASAGAGYSSQTGVTGFLELGHNNLFGNGQSVAIRLERGGKQGNIELSFTEPWFRDTPLTLGADIFNTRRDLDFYNRKDVGGGVRLGRPLPWPDYTRGLLSYDLRDVTLSSIRGVTAGEPANLAELRSTHWPRRVSSVTLSFTRNSTDSPFYPTRGSRLTWSSEVAGGLFGGVEHFSKETVELRNFTKLQSPLTLMLRGKAGFLAGSTVPDYERFRLGGTTSDYLRGYPDYYVVPRANITRAANGRVLDRYPGGREMLILTSEIQFPIADPLHGLFFFEAGNTWNSTRDLDLGDLRKSLGLGIRLEVPALGRVGFDLGYGFDREEGARWETHFQLGNTF